MTLAKSRKRLPGYRLTLPLDASEIVTEKHHAIHIIVPWATLVSDNAKYGVLKGRMLLTSKYRKAKADVGWWAVLAMNKARSRVLEGRLGLYATIYEPDSKRGRDVSNFCKLVHDALIGIVYVDDKQLDDVRWQRGAVDTANPRVEIFVSPLSRTEE